MNLRETLYAGIAVLGLAATIGSCHLLTQCSDNLNEARQVRSAQQYLYLQDLADLDQDGELSEMERTLMHERLNRHNGIYNSDWEPVLDYPFTTSQRTRINTAVHIYEQERR
tara:strand:+ start:388 stop:723 length:336 start_codon:yes stop_codon:yes gene_type:complete